MVRFCVCSGDFVDHQIFRGSWEIARYANEITSDGRLGDLEAIAPWQDLSETALAEGRTAVVRCILNNDQALEEALPALVPKIMRRPLRFIARDAAQRLDRKYAHLAKSGCLHQALVHISESLMRSDSDYLLGSFSYADMAMAVVLEVIAPIAETQPPLGPATQCCWNNPTLAAEFKDFLDWRDRLAANAATSYSQFKFGLTT